MEFHQQQNTQQQQLQQLRFNYSMQIKLELLTSTQYELEEQLHAKLDNNPAVIWRQRQKNTSSEDEERRDRYARWLEEQPEKVNLKKHLLQQIQLLKYSKIEQNLASWLTYNLDEQGFHSLNPYTLVRKKIHPLLERLLPQLQQLDPLGCYCRDSYHSLQIQARYLKEDSTVLEKLFLPQSLHLLKQNKKIELATLLGISPEELKRFLDKAKKELNPFPASAYVSVAPPLAIELLLQEKEGEIKISYYQNGEMLPKIDPSYQKFAEQTQNKEARRQLREAQILLDSLQGRKKTLLRIAYCIIEQQPHFLEQGLAGLQVLYAWQIAQNLNMHPSTVSRAMRGKYIQTPHGLFNLSQFCKSGSSGKSRSAIKEKMLQILGQQRQKISDQILCNELTRYKIYLSRRTVNKYKHELMKEGRWIFF